MDLLATALGSLCLLWTGLELSRLLARGRRDREAFGSGHARFGAVDLDGDRPLDVTLDRRTRGRRDEDRRVADGAAVSFSAAF